jgi:hypothetical protein
LGTICQKLALISLAALAGWVDMLGWPAKAVSVETVAGVELVQRFLPVVLVKMGALVEGAQMGNLETTAIMGVQGQMEKVVLSTTFRVVAVAKEVYLNRAANLVGAWTGIGFGTAASAIWDAYATKWIAGTPGAGS